MSYIYTCMSHIFCTFFLVYFNYNAKLNGVFVKTNGEYIALSINYMYEMTMKQFSFYICLIYSLKE